MASPHEDPRRAFARKIVEKLRAVGFVAYWAGGCVRDELLGLVPKDYDVATDAPPERIRDVFGRRRTLAIGASFGVITVIGSKAEGQIDVATFRQDIGYSDGRHPDQVAFTTVEHDAQRRDFTINGLFYDPHEERVIDYVGGVRDLEQRIVRAIGEPRQRFAEDKLRMIRAVRFAATYDFELEEQTAKAVRAMASQITSVSAERVGAELRRMLVHPSRARGVRLLHETRLLEVLLPEVERLFEPPGEAGRRTLHVLERLQEPSFPLALAALLLLAGGDQLVAQVSERVRLSKKESERAAWLLRHLGTLDQAADMPWPKLQRLLICEGVDELLALYEAVHSADHPALVRCRELLELPPEQLNPPPLVTGDDLIRHGLTPGKHFGPLLEALRDAQLEGRISTPDEALTEAQRAEGRGQ